MTIFKSMTLTWWQVALLKWSVLFIGIAIGAYFASAFLPYVKVLLAIGLLIAAYLTVVWVRS